MRIAIASDHAGFGLKAVITAHLTDAGHEVTDLGTHSTEAVDYPEYGAAVGRAVVEGRADLGICACGSAIGISIAANKVPGVRAAPIWDATVGHLAKSHNDLNVLCFGERTTGEVTVLDALDAFLHADFEGGRHQRRLDQIAALDHPTSPT